MPDNGVEPGTWVVFDLGYGWERGLVEAVRATEVDLLIPCDGPRTLSRGEIYDDPDEVPNV